MIESQTKTCPRCSAHMILCDTGTVLTSLPAQYPTEYRCGCGHREPGPTRRDSYTDPETEFQRRWQRENQPGVLRRAALERQALRALAPHDRAYAAFVAHRTPGLAESRPDRLARILGFFRRGCRSRRPPVPGICRLRRARPRPCHDPATVAPAAAVDPRRVPGRSRFGGIVNPPAPPPAVPAVADNRRTAAAPPAV